MIFNKKIGLFERGPDGGEVGGPVFVAHRGGCDANRTIIERADNRVDFGAQTRLCQLLWKTPKFAPAGDRRVVVQEHAVRIAALAAAKHYRDDLSAFGVVAKPESGMRMNSYLTIGSWTSSGSGTKAFNFSK
jgi:hypothetical protein